MTRHLLIDVMTERVPLAAVTLAEWDGLLRAAREAGVLSQIAMRMSRSAATGELPARVQPHVVAARALAEREHVSIGWEIDQLERVLRDVADPTVLLKGAAYHAIGLASAAGRLTGDMDVLVPADRTADVEQALLQSGWRTVNLDPKDEAYFRRWLHELPPLQHERRRTLIDVHHTILPGTDCLQLDPALLLSAAVAVEGRSLKVLAPADMFLHSAAHLFRNGRWHHGFRDLLDMRAMVLTFSGHDGFWPKLHQRADELDLFPPLRAALVALERHLYVNLPEGVSGAITRRPRSALDAALDRLVGRALLPASVDRIDATCERARRLLAYWPIPRLQAMRTTVFWSKRLPRVLKPTETPQSRRRAAGPRRPDDEGDPA